MKHLLHKLIAVLTFVGTAGILAGLAPSAALAVTSGTSVTSNDFAFVAEVHNTAVGATCTGSLIHPDWVLTAAHCAAPTSVGDVTVRVGNTRAGTGGAFRRVNRIIVNPSYSGGYNDVALLQLSNPVTSVTPIRLANPSEAYLWDGAGPGGLFGTRDTGYVTGWGYTAPGGPLATQLQFTSANILTPTDAQGLRKIPVDRGPCDGDSGSPLIVYSGSTMVEAGVLKASSCATGSGGYYSEVGAGPNRDWILSHIANMPYTSFGVGDWNGDGNQDVIARQDSTGALWLYPGQSLRSMSGLGRVQIGTDNWKGFTPFGVADWNNDLHPDILARDDNTGVLWLYPGPNISTATRKKISLSSFNDYTPFGVADWDGDGYQDILVRDPSGTLYLGRGSGTADAAVVPSDSLGGGWNKYTPFGVADYDHYNELGYHPDIVARDNDTGNLWEYPGDGRRTVSSLPRAQIGNGWSDFSPFGLAYWDIDHQMDILTREDSTGLLWLYPGENHRGYSYIPRAQIGNGW